MVSLFYLAAVRGHSLQSSCALFQDITLVLNHMEKLFLIHQPYLLLLPSEVMSTISEVMDCRHKSWRKCFHQLAKLFSCLVDSTNRLCASSPQKAGIPRVLNSSLLGSPLFCLPQHVGTVEEEPSQTDH